MTTQTLPAVDVIIRDIILKVRLLQQGDQNHSFQLLRPNLRVGHCFGDLQTPGPLPVQSACSRHGGHASYSTSEDCQKAGDKPQGGGDKGFCTQEMATTKYLKTQILVEQHFCLPTITCYMITFVFLFYFSRCS